MRVENWTTLLMAEIERARELPFRWGSHDCSLFACDVVEKLTGVDHGKDFRGRYKTERGAARMIRDRGGLRKIATDALGSEIPPLTAQRGDVVMAVENGREALGICIGEKCAFVGIDGLTFQPMARVVAAWRVA